MQTQSEPLAMRKPSELPLLIVSLVAVAFFGILFVAGAKSEEIAMMRVVIAALAVLYVPVWWLLRKKFSGWSIFVSYVLVSILGALIAVGGLQKMFDTWWILPFCALAIACSLYSGRKNQAEQLAEQLNTGVAWCVAHGLWDRLEEMGVPHEEIKRLKKLSPEERDRLVNELHRMKVMARAAVERMFEKKEPPELESLSDDKVILRCFRRYPGSISFLDDD